MMAMFRRSGLAISCVAGLCEGISPVYRTTGAEWWCSVRRSLVLILDERSQLPPIFRRDVEELQSDAAAAALMANGDRARDQVIAGREPEAEIQDAAW